MKHIGLFACLLLLFSACWPTVFLNPRDKSFPEEWKKFYVNPIEVTTATAPTSYGASLSEQMRTGIQNNTSLKLATKADDAQVEISSVVTSYSTTPVAVQQGDQTTQNQLTVNVQVTITTPTKGLEEIKFNASRFAVYSADKQLVDVEQELLPTINQQIVQDVINKLLSNW